MSRKSTSILSKWMGAATFSAVLFFVFPFAVSSQGLAGFAFTEFSADIELREDGSFEVTEMIAGEFFEERHGLFRNIPVQYETADGFSKSIRVRVADVRMDDDPVPYDVFREGDYQVVKIGDPDQTVIGPFVYTIRYSVERAILYGEGQDELYWNVTGNDWGSPIPLSSATVRIPGASADDISYSCYTGFFGSVEGNCAVVVTDGEAHFTATDFLTVAVGFPKGLVAEPTQNQQILWWLADNWDVFSLLIPIGAMLLLFSLWWHRGRDPKGRGTIIAEYEPPGNLRPTEVGTLIDTKVHPKDFSAAIVDLAVRGYLKIIEEEKGVLVFKQNAYTFEKLKDADASLHVWEKEILDAIFPAGKTTSTLKARSTSLASARTIVVKQVYKDMAEKGYYVKNPSVVRWTYFGLAIAVAVIGHIAGVSVVAMTDRPIVLVAGYTTAFIFALWAPFMPKKTSEGTRMYEHAKGFREFLQTAERYRIEWQEKEGIFEAYLPYAMVLGVADKWAKVFEGIQTENPSWYVGPHMMPFQPTEFTNNISSFVSSSAKVAAPSSGGGYSGGGGSSGGGFGGGGGGSW